jgi:large subunit ribosomal protein L30
MGIVAMADKVTVTWVRSGINRLKTHRATLKALGFKHLNQTREHELTPQIKGMLDQVGYLLKVEKAGK